MTRFIGLFLLLVFFYPQFLQSQILLLKGADVKFTSGAIVSSNGGTEVMDGATLTNDGTFKVSKNSTLPQNGNIILNTGSTTNGNGSFLIEQDWINNAFFIANNSLVELFGNTQQYITSSNNTITTFNNLVLTGNGVGNNRKKSLLNVDVFISANGKLTLNNRELETQTNGIVILNPATNAVLNSTTFGSEGFVSSISPGFLYRSTNSSAAYLYPVGSSDGTTRYRPLLISPNSNANQEFACRLNNFNSDNDGFFRSQNDGSILEANDKFYHSIEQTSGISASSIEFFFDPSSDGEWNSTANWKSSLWENMGNVSTGNSSNYSSILKKDWSVSTFIHPYILVNLEDELTVPNVFTPNSDGINDLFLINAKNIAEFNLIIVNRWGNVVFESTDLNILWDGKFNNEPCAEGTYFYKVIAKSNNNKEYVKQGFLNLKY